MPILEVGSIHLPELKHSFPINCQTDKKDIDNIVFKLYEIIEELKNRRH